jgi:hypothetical protein
LLTSLRVCAIHGNAASIVAGVSRTPGRISFANARVGGKAAFNDDSAAFALRSVGASSRTEAERLPDSLANAAIVVLRFVISPCSWDSFVSSASAVRAVPRIRRETSRPGSVPSSASNTCAVERSAAGMSSYASLNDCAAVLPFCLVLSAVLTPLSTCLRSSRESLCSDVST